MKINILSIILAFLLSGCITDQYGNHCPDSEEDGAGYITISFNLVASNNGILSRAEESDSEWPEFEDYLDTDDLAFFIYADLGSTQPLIKYVDMGELTNDPHTNISGGPHIYTVRVSVPKGDIDNTIPEGNDNIQMGIVAFANTNGEYKGLISSDETSSFNGLIEKASEWKYNIFGTIYPGTGSTNGSLKSGAKVPMYGTKTFNITRNMLSTSRPDYPIPGGQLSLLRSLAKVKVEDKISTRDANGLPRIESVTFTTGTDNAFDLPDNAANYSNGSQITAPNICTGNKSTITLLKRGTEKSWIGYIPEQSITSDVPLITINVTYEVDADNNPTLQQTYKVPMSGYLDQAFDFGDDILRNYIYTLSVDVDEVSLEATINAKVVPWEEVEPLNLDYTKTVYVASDGKLKWKDDTYQSITSNGRIIMKEWTSEITTDNGVDKIVKKPVPLEGTFLIQTPEGATWTAYLVPIAGQYVEAFAFQDMDEDGNYKEDAEGTPILVSQVSGKIKKFSGENSQTPEFSHLRIYTLQDKPLNNVANRAYLQVIVTIENGEMTTVVEAPINKDGITRYEIIQNP